MGLVAFTKEWVLISKNLPNLIDMHAFTPDPVDLTTANRKENDDLCNADVLPSNSLIP